MSLEQELFIAVDDNDNIIGFLPEDEYHAKGIRHRTASIVVYNDKGGILLQHRSPYKRLFPDMWTVSASGHVSKKAGSDEVESYLEGAKKEFREELGIEPPPFQFVAKIPVNSPEHTTMTAIFIANHNGPFEPNLDEVVEVRFFEPEDLKEITPRLTPNARIVLQELGLIRR